MKRALGTAQQKLKDKTSAHEHVVVFFFKFFFQVGISEIYIIS